MLGLLPRRARVGAAALLAAGLLVGCSPDASGGSAGQDSAEQSSSPGDMLTAGQLSSVLLDLDELPAGYELDNEADDDDDDTDFGTSDCARELEEFAGTEADDSVVAEVERAFTSGQDGLAGLEQTVSSHEDENELDASLDQFREIVADCGQITFSADGVPATLTVSEADVPEHGDDTIGLRMQGQIAAFPFELVIGANRLGHNVHSVMVGGLGEADLTALRQAMDTGFAKLEQAHTVDPNAPAATTAPEPTSTLRTGGPGTYTGQTEDGLQIDLALPAAGDAELAEQVSEYLTQVGGEFAGSTLVQVSLVNNTAEEVFLSGVTVVSDDGQQIELEDPVMVLNETNDANPDAYSSTGSDLNDELSQMQLSDLKPGAKGSQLFVLRDVDPAQVRDVYVAAGGEDVQLGLK